MKSILISIQPKWCGLIADGEKTIEVRKTKPKLETPFKCYIYRTLEKSGDIHHTSGKVIGEFVCDEITFLGNISTDRWDHLLGNVHESHKRLVTKDACLTEKELRAYGGKYGWHISDLVIYEKPKELNEFRNPCKEYEKDYPQCGNCDFYHPMGEYPAECDCEGAKPLKRPPQSWCYIEKLSYFSYMSQSISQSPWS